MTLVSLALILVCTPTAVLDFAMPKWKADQHIRIEDTYKWLFQATRGGEHAAPDRESARQWLDDEWKGLDKSENDEALWEPLCRDGSIGRLNLRVFKARGGREDDILDAFLASSREFRETGSAFTNAWTQLGRRLKKHASGQLTYSEWLRLDAEMKPKNYPAIHHSRQFNEARSPAYRILTAAERKRLTAKLK